MNDSTPRRRPRAGQVTGASLGRLIEEGEPPRGTHGHDRPTETALRDLAAALNIAASASVSPASEQAAAQEALAVAAFRGAHSANDADGRMRRRALRGHLRRARTAMLAGVTAAVLGGGAAVATASGGVPFVGGDNDGAAAPSAPATDGPGATSPGASALPVEQAQPTTPAATPAAPVASAEGPGADVGDRSRGATDGASASEAPAAAEADENALRSLCTARARNPRLAPPALVRAAGDPDGVDAYCESLPAAPAEDADPGDKADGKSSGPPPRAPGDEAAEDGEAAEDRP